MFWWTPRREHSGVKGGGKVSVKQQGSPYTAHGFAVCVPWGKRPFLAQSSLIATPCCPPCLGTWLGRCPAADVSSVRGDSRLWLAENWPPKPRQTHRCRFLGVPHAKCCFLVLVVLSFALINSILLLLLPQIFYRMHCFCPWSLGRAPVGWRTSAQTWSLRAVAFCTSLHPLTPLAVCGESA